MTHNIFEIPESTFKNIRKTDRIFLQEIQDGCILIEREGKQYKHKLSKNAFETLLMILNGEVYLMSGGRKKDYDPE